MVPFSRAVGTGSASLRTAACGGWGADVIPLSSVSVRAELGFVLRSLCGVRVAVALLLVRPSAPLEAIFELCSTTSDVFVTADWLALLRLPASLFAVIPGVRARYWLLICSSALVVAVFLSIVATGRLSSGVTALYPVLEDAGRVWGDGSPFFLRRCSSLLPPLVVTLPSKFWFASPRCASGFPVAGRTPSFSGYLPQMTARIAKGALVLVTVRLRMRAGTPPKPEPRSAARRISTCGW